MGRRHVKEFRPDEVLSLIAADRNGRTLSCPCCGSDSVSRDPPRDPAADPSHQAGKVRLSCTACGRLASYVERPGGEDETVRQHGHVLT